MPKHVFCSLIVVFIYDLPEMLAFSFASKVNTRAFKCLFVQFCPVGCQNGDEADADFASQETYQGLLFENREIKTIKSQVLCNRYGQLQCIWNQFQLCSCTQGSREDDVYPSDVTFFNMCYFVKVQQNLKYENHSVCLIDCHQMGTGKRATTGSQKCRSTVSLCLVLLQQLVELRK